MVEKVKELVFETPNKFWIHRINIILMYNNNVFMIHLKSFKKLSAISTTTPSNIEFNNNINIADKVLIKHAKKIESYLVESQSQILLIAACILKTKTFIKR